MPAAGFRRIVKAYLRYARPGKECTWLTATHALYGMWEEYNLRHTTFKEETKDAQIWEKISGSAEAY